jgi:hypothetical protein
MFTSNLAGNEAVKTAARSSRYAVLNRATPYRRSYVNDAVEVLRLAGRSMKLQELQTTIGDRRGKRVSLGSLKVCLSRYVDSNDSSKLLTRIAPGLFGLSEWAQKGHGYFEIPAGQSADLSLHAFAASVYQRTHAFPAPLPSLSRRSDSSALSLFLWTLPADEPGGLVEQRVYVRATDRRDVVERLFYAGVERANQGIVQPVETTQPVADARDSAPQQ